MLFRHRLLLLFRKGLRIFEMAIYDKMAYNIRTLQGMAELTALWEHYKENLFNFACNRADDPRWKDEEFRNHMRDEYFRSSTPITLRLYSLDEKNLKTLIQYVEDVVMRGLADINVE